MWSHVYTGGATASREAVWKVLRNIDEWASWDTSMEWVRLQGPFQIGSEVVMKPKGQEPITSVIVEAMENEVYADESNLGDVILRFSHTLEALDNGGTRVIHRLEITGPAADQVGPDSVRRLPRTFPRRWPPCSRGRPPEP
ncbi:MAG: polyketide cyclase [Dehalococcoidia bacterium]